MTKIKIAFINAYPIGPYQTHTAYYYILQKEYRSACFSIRMYNADKIQVKSYFQYKFHFSTSIITIKLFIKQDKLTDFKFSNW